MLEKIRVLKNVSSTLAEVESGLKPVIHLQEKILPAGALTKTGKISRGENYKGLPYLVLDFPRYSSGNQLFIYRTMFWWGNYFLCLLVTQNCGFKLKSLDNADTFKMNVGPTPWNYDFSDSCWQPLNDKIDHSFIAIGRKISFEDAENLGAISRTTFEDLMSFLTK